MTYAIIGDDSAPNFFRIDARNGAIQVSNNLENDDTRTYSVSYKSFRISTTSILWSDDTSHDKYKSMNFIGREDIDEGDRKDNLIY